MSPRRAAALCLLFAPCGALGAAAPPLRLPPAAEEARRWAERVTAGAPPAPAPRRGGSAFAAMLASASAAHGQQLPTLTGLAQAAEDPPADAPPLTPAPTLACIPIPDQPMGMELCFNSTDLCLCGPGGTECVCAPTACMGLGDLAPLIGLPEAGQTAEQADASGVKITLDRFLSATIVRPRRTALGDPSGCEAINASHWCLWLTSGSGQPIIGGACVPRGCSAADQARVRNLAVTVYTVRLYTTPPSSPEYLDLIGAVSMLASGTGMGGGVFGIYCTSTQPGEGWWERTGGTRQKQFSSDGGAQLCVAIVGTLVSASAICSAALRAREWARAGQAGAAEGERLLPADPTPVRQPPAPAAAVASVESSGEYQAVSGDAEQRMQATQIFGDGELVPEVTGSDAASAADALTTAAGIRAEIARGLRTSNTGGWASPETSPTHRQRRQGDLKHSAVWDMAALWSLVECFDAGAHWNALLKCSKLRPTSFLHGLRTWSMAWVIFGHTGFDPTIPGFDNSGEIVQHYQRSFRFVLAYGFTAVDTFFFMSGFLSTYLLIPRWPKKLGWSVRNAPRIVARIFLVYLDRYARLTPLYAMIILFSRYLVQYIPQGPINVLADMGSILGECGRDWYTNLLYVNTVMKEPGSVCLGHTWYLGNDMLYVWLFTPFAVLFTYGRAGAITATAVVLAALVTTVGCATHYGGSDDDFSKAYFRPWNRAAPYLYGMLGAFALRTDSVTQLLKAWTSIAAVRAVLYLLAAGHLVGVLLWQWGRYGGMALTAGATPLAAIPSSMEHLAGPRSVAWNRGEAFLYFYGWGLGLLILTLVWGQGHGGWVTRFLGHPIFECVGRLTYGAYLTHPIVLVVMKLSTTAGAIPHFNDFWLLSNWTAATFGAFTCAAILFVLIERPAGALWDVATQQNKRK